jgi:hypothetical protein
VLWPGLVISITPPHRQVSLQLSLNAGTLPISTVGEPGAQGAAVAGTQGIGVSAPAAAAVAAATVGLAVLLQVPNGMTFTIGAKSWMVAAGGPPAIVRLTGSTARALGAAPKLQRSMAPAQTWVGTGRSCEVSTEN